MSGLAAFEDLLAKQLGYPVQPDGTTKYGRDYGGTNRTYWGADFCDMGLSYVAKYSGNAAYVGYFAYVPSHMNWFIHKNQFTKQLGKNRPIFFDWNANGIPNHIGWLEDFDNREIHTIEFNHLTKVVRVTRPRNSLILGTGIVKWPGAPVVAPPNTADTPKHGRFYVA